MYGGERGGEREREGKFEDGIICEGGGGGNI